MKLKAFRERAGKTQRELAAVTGLSLRGYQYLEERDSPKLTANQIQRLSRFLHINVSELIE
jgi:transcriptional regulator with XRE-family HTH domain